MKHTAKSGGSHAILDVASRQRKAEKIVQVLNQKADLRRAQLLDIGTGAGYIAHYIAKHVASVTSVDLVDERKIKTGYTFVQVHDETMPFASNSFDVVVSNHVIEHVNDQPLHVSEVLRVLKPGGLAYFATPNRNWLIDPHYRLPFINWLPRSTADAYLKAVRGEPWDIHPTTVRHIQKYAGKQQKVDSIVVEVIKNPEEYHLDAFKSLHPITKRTPRFVLQAASNFSPTILLIITKT